MGLGILVKRHPASSSYWSYLGVVWDASVHVCGCVCVCVFPTTMSLIIMTVVSEKKTGLKKSNGKPV